MATLGGAIGVPSFSSSRVSINTRTLTSSLSLTLPLMQTVGKRDNELRCVLLCSAVQESSASASASASAVATEKEEKVAAKAEAASAKPKPAEEAEVSPGKKPKPAAAAAKLLPQMMEEDVIPPLRAILEAQDDISDIELSFQDNKLEGSFLKKGTSYSFWAFFPTGNLTGAKGFSISSYGSGASTVEPFLVDERKPTANHVVFWVEKRLAAQGIIPVWNQ